MALVQFDKKDGTDPLTTLVLNGVAVGNTLFLDIHVNGSAAAVGAIAVSDSVGGGSWVPDGTQVSPAGDDANQVVRFRKAGVAAGDYTFTVNPSSGYISAIAHEWDGALELDVVTQQGNASGNNISGTYTSPTLTTTQDGAVIIATIGTDTSPPSGFVPGASETEIADHNARIQVEYLSAPTAGGYTMSWALGAGSTDCCCLLAAYYIPSPPAERARLIAGTRLRSLVN